MDNISIDSREQLYQSLSERQKQMKEIENYVKELFFSAIKEYSINSFTYTDTIAQLAYNVRTAIINLEKLKNILLLSDEDKFKE